MKEQKENNEINWFDVEQLYRKSLARLIDIETQFKSGNIYDINQFGLQLSFNELLFEAWSLKEDIKGIEEGVKDVDLNKKLKEIRKEVLSGIEGYKYECVN